MVYGLVEESRKSFRVNDFRSFRGIRPLRKRSPFLGWFAARCRFPWDGQEVFDQECQRFLNLTGRLVSAIELTYLGQRHAARGAKSVEETIRIDIPSGFTEDAPA